MQTPNPNFPVHRSNGGERETLTPVKLLQIPDMWHLHVGLKTFGEVLRKLDEADDDKLVALKDALNDIGYDHMWLADAGNLERCAEGVLDVWHLAADLKRNLAGEFSAPTV